jgi:hypothetical protein
MTTPARYCVAAILLAFAVCWPAPAAAATHRERQLLEASGVPPAQVARYAATLDRLASEFQRAEFQRSHSATAAVRAKNLHAFLHRRVLRGSYLASASDIGITLDGGPFNCVAATVLFCLIGQRCGLESVAMSTPGHVWCRVYGETSTVDIETTCPDWFELAAKYRNVPTSSVSPAMARHRQRLPLGRPLDDRKLLAVLHFNRGVTLIRENRLGPAAWANLQALALDPDCVPARENLAAIEKELSRSPANSLDLRSSLIYWALARATGELHPALATN